MIIISVLLFIAAIFLQAGYRERESRERYLRYKKYKQVYCPHCRTSWDINENLTEWTCTDCYTTFIIDNNGKTKRKE